MSTEIHGATPELRQQLALHLYMFNIFGVFRWFDGWNDLIQCNLYIFFLVRV